MNMDLYNSMPQHIKDYVDSLPVAEKEALFPDKQINWEFVYFLRDKYINICLVDSPFSFASRILNDIHWTIQEFVQEIINTGYVTNVTYLYDEVNDFYTITFDRITQNE